MTTPERPRKGGSYTRQKDGSLKREAFTKPAAARRRTHRRKPAPDPASKAAEGQAKPALAPGGKRVAKETDTNG